MHATQSANNDTRMLNILWLQSGGCGGCSMSLLCADTPDLVEGLRLAGINILWHPALSLASGADFMDIMHACLDGSLRFDVLCLEGAVLNGPHGSGRFHMLAGSDVPMRDWVEKLARKASYVCAVGSCAAWGGVSAGADHVTEATGLQYEDEHAGGLLGSAFRSTDAQGQTWPVINIAGCPTHPAWVLETWNALAAGLMQPQDLDALGRPRFYADKLVHHGCTRNEFYEFKASAEKPSDLGCMMENMGCKGTQAHADCNTRLWNGQGSCIRGGYACISCTEPGFQDPGHAFDETPKIGGIPIGLPTDMPKAWFVALASLSKSATPQRVRKNARTQHNDVAPAIKKTRLS